MYKKVMPLLLLATLFLFWIHPASAVITSVQTIKDIEKPWTITFNEDVNERADFQSIYIQSADKVKHEASIHLSAEFDKVIVKPTKPYRFGTEYTLVIPEGFLSASGKTLKQVVTKSFILKSDYIDAIRTDATPWLTNIIVERKGMEATKMTVTMEDFSEEMTLHREKDQFSRGMIGLAKGQTIIIRAYDEQNTLLDTQYYDIQ